MSEGVVGLVDPRLRAVSDGTGRADRRVVEALRKVVDEQTGPGASGRVLAPGAPRRPGCS
ncbi:hypothetical protein ACF1A5_27235 [Streptomyces sp. NPDC014864]|uniref:hypothetical protein n=1 Tax=Streptomyces sp. NPDC014864 TaxID=3364924 RepID=UPI0037005305